MQSTLFPDPPLLPGLQFQAEMLTVDEEQQLLAQLAALPFAPFEFQRWQGNRRVVSFGWRYDFNDARLQPAPALPQWLEPLRERAAHFANLAPETLVQTLVTEYAPGSGIGWHRDRPVFDQVVGLSLAAPCTLRFRRRLAQGFERLSLPLPPRSAYHLSGAARSEWEHSIVPLERLRYSITFRSLKPRR